MKKILKIVAIIFGITIVIAIFSGGSKKSGEQKGNSQSYKYEELSRIENNNDENISILIATDESKPEELIKEVQATCKKQCNITLFNDKKAYELETEYNKMTGSLDTNPDELKKWKEQNYVFLADHIVGQAGYSFGPYSSYPLRDWYYKELKGE
jgi:hypothetical protein